MIYQSNIINNYLTLILFQNINYILLKKIQSHQMYSSKQIDKVSKILQKNQTNYWTGDECKKFENVFSKYHNVKYSLAVSNGSVALEFL